MCVVLGASCSLFSVACFVEETHGTTQNKMVHPGKGREQYERKELARNQKRRIVGRREKLGTSHSLSHMK
jgi:hypothetical protein